VIETIRQGLKQDGFDVSISKICQWFAVPRRTVYYKPAKSEPKVQVRFAEPIKAMIEENPSFGYRTVAHLLDFNKNTVQRVFQLMGWHLSRSGKAKTAESALEQALIARYGTLGRVRSSFLLRSDNGLVFTSRSYTALVRSYGLKQEFITPHCPQQNGMIERVIWTLKEQCVHRHRFETLQHASRVIGDWIGFYNTRRPHQALGMKTPAEAFALAA
jgi:putative transposase